MAAKNSDKILLGLALLALGAAAAWITLKSPNASLNTDGSGPELSGVPYKPVNRIADTVPVAKWEEPPSQAAGPLWVFEVFSPPEIIYKDGAFLVKPATIKPPVPPAPDFGLEFIKIIRDEFPLQLVSCSLDEGLFLNTQNGDTFYAKAGHKVRINAQLEFEIRSFEIRQGHMKVPAGNMDIPEAVGYAEVVNVSTGQISQINSQEHTVLGKPYVVFRIKVGPKAGNLTDPIRVGDAPFTIPEYESTYLNAPRHIAEAKYQVDEIVEATSTSPAKIVVTRHSPDLKNRMHLDDYDSQTFSSLSKNKPAPPKSKRPAAVPPPPASKNKP